MENYERLMKLGEGTYGSVFKGSFSSVDCTCLCVICCVVSA
jgi:hypothetical protein